MYKWFNKEKARYYSLTVNESEENFVLKYEWGSCRTNRGGRKEIKVESKKEAFNHITKLMKRRRSRGYDLVAYPVLISHAVH